MNEFNQKAVDIGSDIAKQLLALAIAGIGFTVAIADERASHGCFFWFSLVSFSTSAALGFVFLMHLTAIYSDKREPDVYSPLSRILAVGQFLTIFLALLFVLLFDLRAGHIKKTSQLCIQTPAGRMVFPIDPEKSQYINLDSYGNVRVSQR